MSTKQEDNVFIGMMIGVIIVIGTIIYINAGLLGLVVFTLIIGLAFGLI